MQPHPHHYRVQARAEMEGEVSLISNPLSDERMLETEIVENP